MSTEFENGFHYVQMNLASSMSETVSQMWLNKVEEIIDNNQESISNKMLELAQKHNNSADILQGFMAEAWHEGTFNANAKVHSSSSVASMPELNSLGSVDVRIESGNQINDFSLKSYKTAKGSVKAMSETPWERFNKLKSKEEISFEEFLDRKDVNIENAKKSLYVNQGKLIPTEQIEEAKALLERKIDSLKNKLEPTSETPFQIARYQEVLDTLTDVVSDKKGTTSIKLTHSQAIELAKAANNGGVSKELLEECGLDISNLVTAEDIVQESLKAGLSAAALSFVISISPVIVNAISKLIAEGEINANELRKGGINALSSSAKSFLMGSVTAAINLSVQTGKLGGAFKGLDPTGISTLVVIVVGTLENAFRFASGKINKQEMARQIMRLYVTTAFAYAGGVALTAVCEGFPLAYMIGSFIGSVIGGLLYSATENLFISYCIDSGCTFFGLVDQNYELPEDIIREIGLDTFKVEVIDYTHFEYDEFKPATFVHDSFEYEHFGVKVLKRGVIGVYSIGYTA